MNLNVAHFIVAMIVMMNPLGGISVFINLTSLLPLAERKHIAVNTTVAIMVICLATIWLGEGLLNFFGISIPSFRCAGGIILFMMGFAMLHPETHPSKPIELNESNKPAQSIAIVPMGLPIIIGPGTLSTLILTINDHPQFLSKIYFSLLSFGLCLGMGALLYFAQSIVRVMGQSTMSVITRIMGLFLMAIAAGMLAEGIRGLIPALN